MHPSEGFKGSLKVPWGTRGPWGGAREAPLGGPWDRGPPGFQGPWAQGTRGPKWPRGLPRDQGPWEGPGDPRDPTQTLT